MTHCPWCGSAGNSFTHLTPDALVCPDCEKGVRPEWKACPWCYAGRFEGNGRRPPADPKAVRVCSTRGCEGQLRPFMRYCPLCKAEGEARVVAPRAARPLPEVPLAHLPRLLPLLPVVRPPRAPRGELPGAVMMNRRGPHEHYPRAAALETPTPGVRWFH